MRLLILVLGFFAVTSGVQAQQDARARFEAGVAAYDAKKYETALEAFTDAYRIKPHPVVRLNIANCYERLGRHTDAEDQYEKFLEEMPDSDKVPEVRRSLARIAKRIGTLHLDVSPSSATVSLDGQTITHDQPLRVSAGRYTIRAEAPGYSTRSEEVAVPGGSEPHVRLHLERSAEERPAAPSEEPSTPVALDDTSTWNAEDDTGSEGEGTSIPTATWIAGGAAVVLAAGALTFGFMALSAESDFEEAVTRSNNPSLSADARMLAIADGQDAADQANTLALTADLLWIGSAAAAGAAIVFLVTQDDDESDEASFAAAPIITPYGAGAALRSTF